MSDFSLFEDKVCNEIYRKIRFFFCCHKQYKPDSENSL